MIIFMSSSELLGSGAKIFISIPLLAANPFIGGHSFICTHFTELSERIGLSSILIFGVISITLLTLGYFYPVLFNLAFSALKKKTREV